MPHELYAPQSFFDLVNYGRILNEEEFKDVDIIRAFHLGVYRINMEETTIHHRLSDQDIYVMLGACDFGKLTSASNQGLLDDGAVLLNKFVDIHLERRVQFSLYSIEVLFVTVLMGAMTSFSKYHSVNWPGLVQLVPHVHTLIRGLSNKYRIVKELYVKWDHKISGSTYIDNMFTNSTNHTYTNPLIIDSLLVDKVLYVFDESIPALTKNDENKGGVPLDVFLSVLCERPILTHVATSSKSMYRNVTMNQMYTLAHSQALLLMYRAFSHIIRGKDIESLKLILKKAIEKKSLFAVYVLCEILDMHRPKIKLDVSFIDALVNSSEDDWSVSWDTLLRYLLLANAEISKGALDKIKNHKPYLYSIISKKQPGGSSDSMIPLDNFRWSKIQMDMRYANNSEYDKPWCLPCPEKTIEMLMSNLSKSRIIPFMFLIGVNGKEIRLGCVMSPNTKRRVLVRFVHPNHKLSTTTLSLLDANNILDCEATSLEDFVAKYETNLVGGEGVPLLKRLNARAIFMKRYPTLPVSTSHYKRPIADITIEHVDKLYSNSKDHIVMESSTLLRDTVSTDMATKKRLVGLINVPTVSIEDTKLHSVGLWYHTNPTPELAMKVFWIRVHYNLNKN